MAPHTSSLAFSFLACACALLGIAPHTPNLAFSFLACTWALWGGGVLRTRQVLLFLFWRVPVPCWDGSAHAKSCFFFSGVCLCPVGNGSAHAKSCFFFSGVYLCPVGMAPHTPNLAFSLTCKHDDLLVLKHPPEYFLFMLKKSMN